MNSSDKIITYHGTSDAHALELIKGKIDTSIGGGELGQGFYLGTALHVAKAWAKQCHNCEAVVEFQMYDNDFWNFDILCLTNIEAIMHRSIIRVMHQTRTHKYLKDIVWGPIVGGTKVYSDQHKWESSKGENYLNGKKVLRRKR
mgnify:CR=1 FL=1